MVSDPAHPLNRIFKISKHFAKNVVQDVAGSSASQCLARAAVAQPASRSAWACPGHAIFLGAAEVDRSLRPLLVAGASAQASQTLAMTRPAAHGESVGALTTRLAPWSGAWPGQGVGSSLFQGCSGGLSWVLLARAGAPATGPPRDPLVSPLAPPPPPSRCPQTLRSLSVREAAPGHAALRRVAGPRAAEALLEAR